MKVKCTAGDLKRVTNGKMYDILGTNDDLSWYFISNDEGMVDHYHKSHFTVIDEPKIEVGSEWVWNDTNQELIVKCVGDSSVFYQWKEDKSEGCEEIEQFLKYFTPKPKTVTMYFWRFDGDLYATNVEPTHTPLLFTREIELP